MDACSKCGGPMLRDKVYGALCRRCGPRDDITSVSVNAILAKAAEVKSKWARGCKNSVSKTSKPLVTANNPIDHLKTSLREHGFAAPVIVLDFEDSLRFRIKDYAVRNNINMVEACKCLILDSLAHIDAASDAISVIPAPHKQKALAISMPNDLCATHDVPRKRGRPVTKKAK